MTKPSDGPRHVTTLILAAMLPIALLALLLACQGGGGPNTQPTFRAVYIEPPPGSDVRGCGNGVVCRDTIRVTFNRAIDTTAVFDVEAPRYFRASMSPSGYVLDIPGTTVTNEMRTLVIPFQLNHDTTYDFTLLVAQDEDGHLLQDSAATSFATGACTTPCP